MINYDKYKIREQLDNAMIFQLLDEWGGEPIWGSSYILSHTICHNPPHLGSLKLYYYFNTGLFRCFTGCAEPIFDIFELYIKVFKIQKGKDIDLNDAVRSLAQKFGIAGEHRTDEPADELEDWKIFANYDRIQDIELKTSEIVLKEYDPIILTRFNYDILITPWLEEDITQEVITHNRIGYYPGGDQITIPHFDEHNRFIGLRGRALSKEEGELYGKYKPLKINQQLYNHPLGMNLYNLNNSKNNIPILKKAIIFEGEKSCLLYASYFGIDNDISVACCGSSISLYQIEMLQRAGAQEIIIAFDRQFQSIGDDEFKKLKANLLKIHSKYKNDVIISFIFDKEMITDYKSSPIDHGPDIFLQLFKERIVL